MTIAFTRDGDQIVLSTPEAVFRIPAPAVEAMEAMARLLEAEDFGERAADHQQPWTAPPHLGEAR